MKKLFLSLCLILIALPSWAGVSSFNFANGTLKNAMLDVNNKTTNNHTGTTFTLASTDGYIMQFDLSSITGQVAAYAHLNIWYNRGAQHTNPLYRVLPSVDTTTATWNLSATGVNWSTAGALAASTDYTATNSASFVTPGGAYQLTDVTALVNDCLINGNTCNILMRETGAFNIIDMANNATNPPFMTIATGTPGMPNLWYVRDGGGPLGTSSSTCNGTANVVFTGANGPNCAVTNPKVIVGVGNAVQWNGGDIMYVDGDSDTSFAFTVSGVTTRPAVGDTYTNNGHTYTVTVSLPTGLSSGTISMSGAGLAPTASGTLTRATGSGDATISFSAEGAAQAIYDNAGSTLTIPEGVVGQQTKIIGTGSQYPQLFADGAFIFIDASASYIDLENLDLTDHDNCLSGGPIGAAGATINPDGYDYVCGLGGTSHKTNTGIQWGGTGTTFTNLLVHNFFAGMGNKVANFVSGNITLNNVKIFGNSFQGAIIGDTASPVMTGTISAINSMVDFNGCGQRYPLQNTTDLFNNIGATGFSHSVDSQSNYYNCYGQGQGGYGDGYGFGAVGSVNAGNWTVIGTSLSFNTQEGLDTLHGLGNGTVELIRSRFEGNGGQQIKPNGQITDIENSIINGDCAWWLGSTAASTTTGKNQPSGAPGFLIDGESVCRVGETTQISIGANSQTYVYGNTIASNGVGLIVQGTGCTSSTGFHIKNNIFLGGGRADQDGTISYITSGAPTGNEQLATYIYLSGDFTGNGVGTCGPVGNGSGGLIVPDEGYNIVYNTKNNNSGCSATRHDICGTDPGFTTTIPMGTPSGAISTYYTSTQMANLEILASGSPSRGAGLTTGLVYTNGTNDYNNFTPLALPVVDLGAIQYGSAPPACVGIGTACTNNPACCSGFCVSGACAAYNCGDGIVTSPEVGDTLGPNTNGQTCLTQGFTGGGSLGVNSGCLSFNTSGCSTPTCTADGGSCSVGSTCCGGHCNASVCSQQTCGDSAITGNEVCDTLGPLLNSQTCITQGFAQGTLGCLSGCIAFDTSGCNNNVAASPINMSIGGNLKVN